MTITEKIDAAIAAENGNVRDALNKALFKIEKVQDALNSISIKELHLFVETRELHISKNPYDAAELGAEYLKDIVFSSIS